MDLTALRARRHEIMELAAGYGARNVRVFGSIVRGEGGPSSDIDLLVEMEDGRNLLDLIGLNQALEECLGVKVDLITEGGISPYLREHIYPEAVLL